MPLTTKQDLFVIAYLSDPSGKKAAIAAGYSASSAEKAGTRLLRHPGVIAELQKRRVQAGADPVAEVRPMTPLEFLIKVVNDPTHTLAQRIRAAAAAIAYTHAKPSAGGKKDEAAERAKAAATTGKFRMRPGPPLALIKNPTT